MKYKTTLEWLQSCRDLREQIEALPAPDSYSNDKESYRAEQEAHKIRCEWADRKTELLLSFYNLPDEHERKALRLFFVDGCSIEYIAHRLTGSTLLARWLLHRAVKHLAEMKRDQT